MEAETPETTPFPPYLQSRLSQRYGRIVTMLCIKFTVNSDLLGQFLRVQVLLWEEKSLHHLTRNT